MAGVRGGASAISVAGRDLSSQRGPGAVAQIRLTLAAPHQIAAGNVVFNFDPAVFGPPVAVDVFSATGDQNGQATVTGNQVVASFSSASGGIGTLPGVPTFM